MRELASARRRASGESSPASAMISAMVFSKKRLVMPEAPTEPISSLSTSRVTLVVSTSGVSSWARRDG
ncbi:Uncharacterised protein [Collinsella intestinalis]|nr:Uncharacterised protein [Collinsella intestinalis]